jgi:cupin 2 domain-containing protein
MTDNLFTQIPVTFSDEIVNVLIAHENLRIERIVSHGQSSPPDFWYDQAQHEFVVLLEGAATIRFGDAVIDLKPGDYINIPAHKRHRVDWTMPEEQTIWLAIHYGKPT